jgi:hypothetical protein
MNIDPANVLKEVIRREKRAQQSRCEQIESYRKEIKELLDENVMAEIAIERYQKAVDLLERTPPQDVLPRESRKT